MNPPLGTVLVIDDDPASLRAFARLELGEQFLLRLCSTTAAGEAVLDSDEVEVALIDQHLGPGEPEGLAFLARVHERDPDCFRIILTGAVDLQFAVSAINQGLIDAILVKPWTHEQLLSLLNQGCETTLLRRHNRQLAHELSERNTALEYLNLQLEKMVEERTGNLRETLDQLRDKQRELVRWETQGTISQIARGLAHELNNPLAAILGYSQRLLRTFASDNDTSHRLEVILREVERCRGLIEQLRNLAAPLDEATIPCQADESLGQAVARLRASEHSPPEYRIVGEIPAVLAAPHSLVRVFEMVLDNARLAGAGACWLSAREENMRVRLSIENDGVTPDENTIRNATRPFYTTMSDQGHRGLGLAIASALLREQGGSIELDRRSDGKPGARCTITLPAPSQTPLRVAALPLPTGGGAVLIVDDDPMITELLQDCLTDAGLNAAVVATASEALAIVDQQPIRAVIADYHLNGCSGVELLRRLTTRRPGLTGHVALITGANDTTTLTRLRGDTGLPVLAKPFRLEQVQRLVREIL